jgi:hypothetical protein
MVGRKNKKVGIEISVYLPFERIRQIDTLRGNYTTRSRFILWALDQVINSKKETPLGAQVGSQAPNSLDSSSNTTLTTPSKEDQQLSIEGGLAGVS